MEETRYLISDAAAKVAVEAHVLRYWEEELELAISRQNWGTATTPRRIFGPSRILKN